MNCSYMYHAAAAASLIYLDPLAVEAVLYLERQHTLDLERVKMIQHGACHLSCSCPDKGVLTRYSVELHISSQQ